MSQPNLHQLRQLVTSLGAAQGDVSPWRAQDGLREAHSQASRMLSELERAPQQTSTYPTVHRKQWDPSFTAYSEHQIAPNLIMVVPAIPVVAPQVPSAIVNLTFQSGPGLIVGWRGTAIDVTPGALAAGPLEQATCTVRMSLNGDSELIRNGLGVDFVPFSNVFANAEAFSPLAREVCADDILQIQFNNTQPIGGSNLQPTLAFAFVGTSRRT